MTDYKVLPEEVVNELLDLTERLYQLWEEHKLPGLAVMTYGEDENALDSHFAIHLSDCEYTVPPTLEIAAVLLDSGNPLHERTIKALQAGSRLVGLLEERQNAS